MFESPRDDQNMDGQGTASQRALNTRDARKGMPIDTAAIRQIGVGIMSLRAYFDAALAGSKPTDSTVKRGEEAARHLKQAQDALHKLRANQIRRSKGSKE